MAFLLTGLVWATFLVTFGFYYYSDYSLDDSTFFFGTTAFCAGDLAFWSGDLALTAGFLVTYSSLDYYEDSAGLTFFDAPFSVLTALTGFFWTFWVYSSIDALEPFLTGWEALGLVTGV